MAEAYENLAGRVEEIVYRNPDNGYTVLQLNTGEANGDGETVAGEMPPISEGEEAVFRGQWTMHPRFGRQFKAVQVTVTLPKDASGILQYLSGGIIKGIGPSTATKIVEAFGAESLQVIEKEPERLAELKGISRSMAKKISREYKNQFASRQALEALAGMGFTQGEAFKAFSFFGPEAPEILAENPYAFVITGNDQGIPFERAQEIAEELPQAPDPSYRDQAAVIYVVQYNLKNGHTCLPRRKVIQTAVTGLDMTEERAEMALDNALEARQLVQEQMDGQPFLFLPHIYEAEQGIGQRIRVMTQYPPRECEIFTSEILAYEGANGIELDEKQRGAIEIATQKGLLILTGGPGTGKTTTVKGIIAMMKNRGLRVALAAPTGRAAQRMTELTGSEAKTIHRLLETERRDGEPEPTFVHNLRNPLDLDAVIVDELSMVDVLLFSALLDALPLHCRLILVGDVDQLPPVGAGNVLSDLIAGGRIDVISLDKVFRQAQKSRIVTNAHRVVAGKMPELDCNTSDSDFFFLNTASVYAVPRKVVELVTRRIPAGYGMDSIKDIQVLCPSRKGAAGTAYLNAQLQAALNPPDKHKAELVTMGRTLREGDRVMQIKNNYDVPWFKKNGDSGAGVFNGDIGILTRIDRGQDILNVRFDDREAMYSLQNADQLDLAYAMTVHKSQGSEFSAVVMPTIGASPKLCYRNLFYTALTRAKSLLILVGTRESIQAMVENDKKMLRYSGLVHFLSVDNDGGIQ